MSRRTVPDIDPYIRSLSDRDLMRWIVRLLMAPNYTLPGYEEMRDAAVMEDHRR